VSEITCFIGCDPGPTTGIAVAYWNGNAWVHPQAYQCDAVSAPALLHWLVQSNDALHTLAAVEEFRAGTGAGARGTYATVTRACVNDLVKTLDYAKVPVAVRPAAAVKPWASGKRLERAGLAAVTAGMPAHARDAMRHLLFCAVHDAGVPDPLARSGYALRVVPAKLEG
jgi:hypothetical protein